PCPVPARKFATVEPLHSQVEDDCARPLLLDQVAGGETVAGLQRLEAGVLEVSDDDLAHDRLVVDDQDTTHRRSIRVNCLQLYEISAYSARRKPLVRTASYQRFR